MVTNDHSYTDLISLYFEGGLTDQEKLSVYRTLSMEEDARLEFEAALFLQRTLDRDSRNILPATMSSDLFRRAGIAMPMEEATTPRRRTVRVAALCFLLGALSMFGISNMLSSAPRVVKEYAGTQVSPTEAIAPTTQDHELVAKDRSSHSLRESRIRSPLRKEIVKRFDIVPVTVEHLSNSPVPADDFSLPVTEEQGEKPVESTLNDPVETTEGLALLTMDTLYRETSTFPRFELSMSHTNSPRYFPDRNVTPRSFLDNSSIAIRFEVAHGHWIGLAGGHDMLPLEIEQNGREEDIDGIDWGGIAYQLELRSEKMPVLYPFLRETIGLSAYGLIAKTGLGVRFSPNEIIHVALGLEHTTMPVRTSEVMRGTGKLSLAYDLSIQF